MAWTTPHYSRTHVDRAGRIYTASETDPDDRLVALGVIDNWRASHSYPLNTMQMSLRIKAAKIDPQALVVQRLKRMPSIERKLRNITGMKLSRMQDLGGCRAVFSDPEAAKALVNSYARARFKHECVRKDDYVQNPPPSGYRSVHLVYRHHSEYPRAKIYNGLQIEIQIRSQLQHAWATAVETVGAFTKQALKSSMGDRNWLRFFALMASELALREGTPSIPDTPTGEQLHAEIRMLAQGLQVLTQLRAYQAALRVAQPRAIEGMRLPAGSVRRNFYVFRLDYRQNMLRTRVFRDVLAAEDAYRELETEVLDDPGLDVVMVSGENLESIRRAYPNYFLDATAFLNVVSEVIG